MKTIKLTLALVMAAVVMGVFVQPALAQTEAEQNQNQEIEIKCETTGYGQVNCWAEGSQEQVQKIIQENGQAVIYRDGRKIPVHEVVDTALDFNTLAVAASTIITGLAATGLKFKSRVK